MANTTSALFKPALAFVMVISVWYGLEGVFESLVQFRCPIRGVEASITKSMYHTLYMQTIPILEF